MNPVSQSHDNDAILRKKAEAVEQELINHTNRFQALAVSETDHIQVLFAELYLLSTRNWLSRLAGRQDSAFAYRVIPIFYERYRAHVLDHLGEPIEAIAPHWRPYHTLARRLTIGSPISAHLLLISLGVRAHVHLDLGLTIHEVEQELDLPQAEWSATRLRLFNQLSEEAFSAAAQEYVESHCARQTRWRRFVLRLFRFGLIYLRPIWLRTLQSWRIQGYKKTSKFDLPPIASQK